VATYNLNKQQEVKTTETSDEPSIHFTPTKIELTDFVLPNLFPEQENFSKKDLRGKFSLVNFFASWCSTCHAEHEILLRLENLGIVDLYGVAWHDIPENTREYLAKNRNPFKKIASDTKGSLGQEAGIYAIPESWIVDDNGNVVMRFRGNLQDFSIREIQEFLKSVNS